MPNYPEVPDYSREDVLNQIIASIAMEELGLSHILNAEGEKIQYAIGSLPGSTPGQKMEDVLTANESVRGMLDATSLNEMMLHSKLSRVLSASSVRGIPGATGTTGPVGPTGPTGARGSGPIGNTGLPGATGATGATGAVGPQGFPGPTGAIGATGVAGGSGVIGPTGATGAIGATGAAGANGANGNPGPDGAKGATGETGDPGANGAIGAEGDVGPTGATGATGPTGSAYALDSYILESNVSASIPLNVTSASSAMPVLDTTYLGDHVTAGAGGNSLTVQTDGIYLVSYSVDYSFATATDIYTFLSKDSDFATIIPGTQAHIYLTTTGQYVTVTKTALVPLLLGESVYMGVHGGSAALTFAPASSASLYAVRLAG